ncbi:MAG: hypothetical protein IPP14_09575 [Planctomycetes bacterium]|nr:hypothetical protein [Planctomycetota bacterium]
MVLSDNDAGRPGKDGHAQDNQDEDIVSAEAPNANEGLRIVAAAFKHHEGIPALMEVLGESDAYLPGEWGRVWRSLVTLYKLGEPISAAGLRHCLPDLGEPNVERTIGDVEREAESFKNPDAAGVIRAATRRADALVKAAGTIDVKIEAERLTALKYRVVTRRGDTALHVDTVHLGQAEKRDALALTISEKSGLTVRELDARLLTLMEQADAVADEKAAERGGPPDKQADMLLALCGEVKFTHDADNTAFATWVNKGARQTHRIRSTAFKTWLAFEAYSKLELVPSGNAMQEALTTLEGKAIHACALVTVHRRVAEHDGRTFLDLCDEAWQSVEIGPGGWKVISDPPVTFVRGTGMLPLPVPIKGDVFKLGNLLNVVTRADLEVCIGWLIGALQAKGPYPILAMNGVQGSAKSTAAELLIGLVDPNKAPLRSAPKSEDDLIVAIQHSRVCCFDNVSGLSDAMSDAICRLATGGGTAKRKLYSDDEAVVLDACAPLLMTGIGSYITRGDAADRALPVALRKLRDDEYRPKAEVMAAFEAARPGILGGLLDALSCCIRRRHEVQGRTRMADSERAVEAAGPALGWQPGHFNNLLATVRDRSRRGHLDDDELAQALMEMGRASWEGSVGQLRYVLSQQANSASWVPRTAKALGNAIRRIEPLLEHVGLIVRRFKRGDERILALEWAGRKEVPKAPQVPPAASIAVSSAGTSARLGFKATPSATNAPPQRALEMPPAALETHAACSGAGDALSDEELAEMADRETDS